MLRARQTYKQSPKIIDNKDRKKVYEYNLMIEL